MSSPQEVVMVLGYPASGKGSRAEEYIKQGYTHLNRDKEGGKVISLLPKMEEELAAGRSVVLDNLFATRDDRDPFIAAAIAAKVPIRCEWMQTTAHDATINALSRMWERYGCIFFNADEIKAHDEAKKDPNIFPIVVIFRYKKEFEKVSGDEGFREVKKIPFVRRPWGGDEPYTGKAAIFDYDETLRTVVGGEYKFPVAPEEVKLLPGRVEKLAALKEEGYLLLGVSNQSGIARKQVDGADAIVCFQHTNTLLGDDVNYVHYVYCPHNVPPTCYCRKPQSGLGVWLIHKFKLDPAQCIFVGDQTTDKTFAKRLGIPYQDQKDFFQ